MSTCPGKRKRDADDSNEQPFKSAKSNDEEDILKEAPRELNILEYAKSHVTEIEALSKELKLRDIEGGKNISQKLPPHMRRRAMSHNIKRLPRSIQAMAKSLYENQVNKVTKRPSRYYRRRPKNLLLEYNRRQRKHVWLETHIWHAKRFHMVDKWGYRLPWKPTQKSKRACYRAASRYCLLQDMSYMSCLEILGDQTTLLEGLSHLTNSQTGQTFAAVSCLAGTKEGHTVIYEFDKYPWNAIGPVTFMWSPSQTITALSCQSEAEISEHQCSHVVEPSASQRQLWIWCHPSSFDQIWTEIMKCFHLTEQKIKLSKTEKSNVESSQSKVLKSPQKETNQNEKFFIHDKYKTNVRAVNDMKVICMRSLTGSILRYRLTGPMSNVVLTESIQQASIIQIETSKQQQSWWQALYADSVLSLGHAQQRDFFEMVSQCQSPAELPPRCIIALTARDPRLTRPVKRTKIESSDKNINTDMSACREKVMPDLSKSPLWIDQVRTNVCETKLPDQKIHSLKSECLVPGMPLELGDSESRIPIILIQRPGVASDKTMKGVNSCLGWGSGWDVLLPKGWGMPFWLSLVFCGARCGGVQEAEHIAFEERFLLFPNDFPDTKAGLEHEIDREKSLVVKYNKVPPAKKPNFTKFGVISPFRCPWNLITRQWNGDDKSNEQTPVSNIVNDTAERKDAVRETDNSIPVGNLCHSTNSRISQGICKLLYTTATFYVLRNIRLLKQLQDFCQPLRINQRKPDMQKQNNIRTNLTALEIEHRFAIVAVHLSMLQRGCPVQFTMISIPTKDDLIKLEKNANYGGPLEPSHIDLAKRKEIKKIGVKKKVKVDRTIKVIDEKGNVNVRNCTRDIIGYLNSGGFYLGNGNGGGIGFVSMLGLMGLISNFVGSKFGPVVLVRDPSSFQYRFAKLSVIV